MFGSGKLSLDDPAGEDDSNINPGNIKFGGGYQNQHKQQQNQDNSNDDDETVGSTKSKSSAVSWQPWGGEKAKSKPKSYGSTSTNRSSLWTIPTPATAPSNNNTNDDNGNGNGNENSGNQQQQQPDPTSSDAGDYSTVITYNQTSGRPDKPNRDWPVKVFFVIQTYALLTCLTLLNSQLLPIIFIPLSKFDKAYLALKIYMCIFTIFFMIVEIDRPIPCINNTIFLVTYVTRGFVYTFFGLICFEEAFIGKLQEEASTSVLNFSWFAIANRVSAIALISLGALYFLMGIFCLQKIRNKYVYGDRAKLKAYRTAMKTFLA